MTAGDPQRAARREGAEDAVVRYLLEEPGFLQRNPDVLRALEVPHDCGEAASLIEAQVTALKRECRELAGRLDALIANARGNEELGQRLHRLVLALLESASLDEIFTTLYQGLEEGFGADAVSLRVFAAARDAQDRGLAEVVDEVPEEALFGDLFAGGQPVCGLPDQEQAAFLFGDRSARVASAALLPLALGKRRGVLAIGSATRERFQPTMGTLYLRQLADVLGRLIARHVR